MHSITELLTKTLEEKEGSLFENYEEALDLLARNMITFSTKAVESARRMSYRKGARLLDQAEMLITTHTSQTAERKKEIADSWAKFDAKVAAHMAAHGRSKEEAEAACFMED